MPDLDGNGIPDIDRKYMKPDGVFSAVGVK